MPNLAAQTSPVYRQMVEDTRQALTLNEIAEITGVKLRAVQNWAAGTSNPDGAQRDRLLELQYVIEQLSDVFDREGIEIRSEEHTSELQSLMRISYAVFCLQK